MFPANCESDFGQTTNGNVTCGGAINLSCCVPK
jgi:hypothetical protein